MIDPDEIGNGYCTVCVPDTFRNPSIRAENKPMMPMAWLSIVLLFFFICTASPSTAAVSQKGEPFSRFYTEFQKAVKADDKEKVAAMIDFDGFTWEETESLRKVRTPEAFLKNYSSMFTPTIKNKIATSKPQRIGDSSYFIIWHTKNTEYSLYFARSKQG
ncbi:MAG: hypothetical protein ABFD98_13330, partial [Syntrophobacteraceae bacterium]